MNQPQLHIRPKYQKPPQKQLALEANSSMKETTNIAPRKLLMSEMHHGHIKLGVRITIAQPIKGERLDTALQL